MCVLQSWKAVQNLSFPKSCVAKTEEDLSPLQPLKVWALKQGMLFAILLNVLSCVGWENSQLKHTEQARDTVDFIQIY